MAIVYKRAVEGRWTVIIRKGGKYKRRITPPDAILSLLLKRGDVAGCGLVGRRTPEDILSYDEWRQHRRFDDYGHKIEIEDPAETSAKFIAKMSQIRQRLRYYAEQGGACPTCKQALPADWRYQLMPEPVVSGLLDPDLHADQSANSSAPCVVTAATWMKRGLLFGPSPSCAPTLART